MYTAKQTILTKDHIPDSPILRLLHGYPRSGKNVRGIHPEGHGRIRCPLYPGQGRHGLPQGRQIRRTRCGYASGDASRGGKPIWSFWPPGPSPPRAPRSLPKSFGSPTTSTASTWRATPSFGPSRPIPRGVYLGGFVPGVRKISPLRSRRGECRCIQSAGALFQGQAGERSPDLPGSTSNGASGAANAFSPVPFQAIKEVQFRGDPKAEVIETVCQGCGICTSTCPQGAIQLSHFTDNTNPRGGQCAMPVLNGKELRIVGFLCNWCSYGGADTAGVGRFTQPTDLRIVRVPCSGRIDPLFIAKALLNGADGSCSSPAVTPGTVITPRETSTPEDGSKS